MPPDMQKCASFFSKIKDNETLLVRLFFSIALVVYFLFAFHHLTKFISADEHYWLPNSGSERIQNYWEAIAERDWKDTRINDKPGITLAYTSGLALLIEKNPKDQIISSNGPVDVYNPQRTEEINFWYRLPIVLVTAGFSFFFFWITKRITKSRWIALFTAVGILSSPILVGISQIVNPDSLFWIFGAAAVFTFFGYVQDSEKKMAVLTALFLGLSLASKYVGVIFFPFFFFMLLAYHFMETDPSQVDRTAFSRKIFAHTLTYVGILAGGMLLFALLMPASFVEPKFFFQGTIGFPGMQSVFWTVMAVNALIALDARVFKSKCLLFLFAKLSVLREKLPKLVYIVLLGTFVFVLFNWLSRHSLIDLSAIPFDSKRKDAFEELPFIKKYIMEFVALTFSLTPISLFLLLFVWVKGIVGEIQHKALVFIISFFYLVFYAAVVEQGLLVTVRYSIILFPFTLLLAGIALVELADFARTQRNEKVVRVYALLLTPIMLLQILSLIDEYAFNGSLRENISRDYFMLIGLASVLLGILAVFFVIKRFPWQFFSGNSKRWFFIIYFGCNILGIALISPFYFSYTNELLPKKYIISGAWGYGGYEAAQFLQSISNGKDITLWADVYGVCEFFAGKCIHTAKIDPQKYPVDYYFRSLQSTINPRFKTNMSEHSIWRIDVDGRPKSFLKLYEEVPR